ncbi:histidine kinase [Marinobacter salinus]|uniref:histidine kinase n=1 Tax=Marinobacter salinus TaxID=1874317 RepID=A0A1D9GQ33_9GAMM|nr:ATP-binding protein [Marinobacter salinus]AOY89654.1 histidine kinase [Marinobacter salinus]
MTVKNGDGLFHTLVWGSRLSIFLLMLIVAFTLDSASSSRHQVQVRQQSQVKLDEISLALQSTILQNIQTVWGLAANVSVQPDINEQQFRQLASVIFQLAPELRNIGLAPGFVIRHIYPLAGNEAALGLDLTRQSLSEQQVKHLLDSRRAIFSGPINLVQGGQGLASRIPIFENETGKFWGVISVILDIQRLFEKAGLEALKGDLNFAISTSDNIENTDAVFFGPTESQWTSPLASTVKMPGVTWTLFAEPVQSWPNHPEDPWLIRSALALMVLIITGGAFWLTSLLLKDREMQRRFWGLFELAPIGIGLYSAHRKVLLRANQTFTRSFGVAAQSLDYFERVFDQNGQQLPEGLGIQESLRKNIRFSGLTGYFPGPDQSLLPVMLQGLKLDAHDSEAVIWLITEDISDQKKVDRMKNEFISTVSHELRTPLTSISGALGLLANNAAGELPDKASKLAQIAYRNSRQLTFLINDLLDIEKLVAGKMPFRLENCPLADMVRDSIENIESFARERQVDLKVGELGPVWVRVDRQRLEQAISNLLSNAIKFSPRGSAVEIHTQSTGENIRLCIQDQGDGVSPDFHDRIFKKFSQADGSDRRDKGGTGLGLAITRELMTNMGGTVNYESPPGRGATFWLELPVTLT